MDGFREGCFTAAMSNPDLKPVTTTAADRHTVPSATDHASGSPPGILVVPCSESRPTDWYLDQVRSGRRGGGAGGVGGGGPSGVRPVTRRELQRAGVTGAALHRHFTRLEHGVYLHNTALLPEKTSGGFTRHRRVPALALVRAHVLHNPGHVATGFAAGTGYGMRYLVHDETLEFLVSRGAECANPAPHLQLTRTRQLESFREDAQTPDSAFPLLKCAAPAVTLGHMLRSLAVHDEARDRRWQVPDLTAVRPHLSASFIRSVQSSDALHQALGSVVPGTADNVRGVSPAVASVVLGSTDVGAESPPETLLRLVVADLAPGLRTQIPVFRDNGSLLTTVDMGWEQLRVFLFYDGEHHLARTQRDHDSEVLAALQRNGGRVFRVTAGQLKDAGAVEKLRELIAETLGG